MQLLPALMFNLFDFRISQVLMTDVLSISYPHPHSKFCSLSFADKELRPELIENRCLVRGWVQTYDPESLLRCHLTLKMVEVLWLIDSRLYFNFVFRYKEFCCGLAQNWDGVSSLFLCETCHQVRCPSLCDFLQALGTWQVHSVLL